MYEHAPYFKCAIRAEKDARHLWFALKMLEGYDPEDFFGEVGAWVERILDEMKLVPKMGERITAAFPMTPKRPKYANYQAKYPPPNAKFALIPQ